MSDGSSILLIPVSSALLVDENPAGPMIAAHLILGAVVHFEVAAHETAIEPTTGGVCP